MIGSLDFDYATIGRDPRAPFRAFSASKKGLLEQAKVGNAIATRRVMKAVHLRPQPRAHLVEEVGNRRVIGSFTCPRETSCPREVVEVVSRG